MRMKAIRVHEPGGPEALRLEEVERPTPGRGEALVRLSAIGVNFIDVYHRTGLYPIPRPFTPGSEGAGVVEAVGEGVTEVRPGDRVTYTGQIGAYAEYAAVAAAKLIAIPAGLDERQAAAAMLQGMTAHYLTRSTFALKPGQTALAHAAAGGVGLLLAQMIRRIGARMIGTVSTPEKAKLAKEAGADEVILYTQADFVAETRRLTGGAGVEVVYDSVGKDTFERGLGTLKPRGYMVLYGQSSGPVPPFDLGRLAAGGSLFVTRPSLQHHTLTREELLGRANDVLGWAAAGTLKLRIEHTYPLAQAAAAHTDLQSRRTTGKLLLIP
jgi:NADPH:quinone reductase